MTSVRWRELSAAGAGAIRVLALEGPGALDALRTLTGGRVPAAGSFALATLRDRAGALLDEALVRTHQSGVLELQLHGSSAVLARVLAELGDPPPLARGSTLEARAEERLAQAASEPAARMLLDQVEGALRREFEALLALGERERVARARLLAERGRVGAALVVPRRVVLAGPVNAGKSTLFNALIGHERVVVDAQAGTTRDAVHELVLLGAYPVELVDTAGRRALAPEAGAAGEVEAAGQRLAQELARAAELVLELVPPHAAAPRARARTHFLASRADEPGVVPGLERLSAGTDARAARATVERLFHSALHLPVTPWQPGAGVPFEPEWHHVLASVHGTALEQALTGWLAAR